MRTPVIVALVNAALLSACSNSAVTPPADLSASSAAGATMANGPTVAEIARAFTAYRQLTAGPSDIPATVAAKHTSVTTAMMANSMMGLTPLEAMPAQVSTNTAMRCTSASVPVAPAPIARKAQPGIDADGGLSGTTAVWVYMNDLALQNRSLANGPFPVGSVVVKQKTNRAGTANDGVGGMVKRPAGYDPKHGDWEYFYFDKPSQIDSGRLASCVDCHASAKKTDYVFGSWVR